MVWPRSIYWAPSSKSRSYKYLQVLDKLLLLGPNARDLQDKHAWGFGLR